MKKYSFSIIVPYYNTKIEQTKFCLESLICQDLTLLKEIIIVDDGSSEKNKNQLIQLVDQLNTHTHTHTRQIIKLTHQKNQGLASARKTGFDYSRGEIILFVDSDDWIIDRNWIFKLNDMFLKYNNIQLILFSHFSYK